MLLAQAFDFSEVVWRVADKLPPAEHYPRAILRPIHPEVSDRQFRGGSLKITQSESARGDITGNCAKYRVL